MIFKTYEVRGSIKMLEPGKNGCGTVIITEAASGRPVMLRAYGEMYREAFDEVTNDDKQEKYMQRIVIYDAMCDIQAVIVPSRDEWVPAKLYLYDGIDNRTMIFGPGEQIDEIYPDPMENAIWYRACEYAREKMEIDIRHHYRPKKPGEQRSERGNEMTNTEALWAAITELRMSADEIMARTMNDNIEAEQLYEAAAQLERMVPRVLDESEIPTYKGALWIEHRGRGHKKGVWVMLMHADKGILLVLPWNEWKPSRGAKEEQFLIGYVRNYYNKSWRAWTAEPDEANRKRVEWGKAGE